MLGLVLILRSLWVVLHVFSELWWVGMTPVDSQGSVANVLCWLPWDMEKGPLRKPSVFPTFILCAGVLKQRLWGKASWRNIQPREQWLLSCVLALRVSQRNKGSFKTCCISWLSVLIGRDLEKFMWRSVWRRLLAESLAAAFASNCVFCACWRWHPPLLGFEACDDRAWNTWLGMCVPLLMDLKEGPSKWSLAVGAPLWQQAP